MYFESFSAVVKCRAVAEIGYTVVFFAVYNYLCLIDAAFYKIFPLGIFYIDGGKAEYARAAVRAFDHFALDEERLTEKLIGLYDVAFIEAFFDERCGNFFAVHQYVFEWHVPYAVFFVFGVIF